MSGAAPAGLLVERERAPRAAVPEERPAPARRFAGRPARVLMTADAARGGWTCALELVRALEEHGVAVALASLGAPPDGAQRAEAGRAANLQLCESPPGKDGTGPDEAAAAEWLLALRDRFQPDVVHLTGYAHAALPWQVPTVVAAHSCRVSWWTAVKREAPPPAWNRYRAELRRALAAADEVVAPTRAMVRCLQSHHAGLGHVRVVPHGRAPSAFPPRGKQPYVMAVARRWDEAKNLGTIDEAARRLDWPVFLAGLPEGSAGGQDGPRFARPLGRLPQPWLAAWLGRASVYVRPARFEPFGLSVLEAALAGCALVLGDLPSLRELWDEAALFVDPDDGAGLASALRRLAGDATRRTGLAQRARARALDLSPARMAQGYLEAYALAGMARSSRQGLACPW